jgi:hypothetical protein
MIVVRSYNRRYLAGIGAAIHHGRSIEGIYTVCQTGKRRKKHFPLTRPRQSGWIAIVVRSYTTLEDGGGTGGDEKRSGK